jgi:hypothetical protein
MFAPSMQGPALLVCHEVTGVTLPLRTTLSTSWVCPLHRKLPTFNSNPQTYNLNALFCVAN